MPFHEQHSSGYGFPSLLLVTCASAGVSELVFKHEWQSEEVVMENHTRSSAVHGKSHTIPGDHPGLKLLHTSVSRKLRENDT